LDLAATTWKLESVNGVAASTEAGSAIFFGSEGVLLGFTGCNVLSGSYQTSGNQISLPVDVVTPFTCTDALKLQEEALVQTITKASNAQRDGDKLTLSNPDNSLSAIFTLSAPADLAGTSGKLDSFNNEQGAFVSVIEGSEITAEFGSDGNLGGTSGCNSYTAAYTTEGSSITIGPAASTLMACAEPAGVMEQESQYLAALETASQYINLGAVLYLSDADNEPVALYVTAGQ
jgi:heat shock protein HslJ